MQRILDPAQIEAFAQRSIPRLRLADPATLYLGRAERLLALSAGHVIGDYLQLIASLCQAQHRASGSRIRATALADGTCPRPWVARSAGIGMAP